MLMRLERRMGGLLEWLCPGDISPHRDQASYYELRTEGTAVWIFNHSVYKEWLGGAHRFVWISGKRTSKRHGKLIYQYSWRWQICANV